MRLDAVSRSRMADPLHAMLLQKVRWRVCFDQILKRAASVAWTLIGTATLIMHACPRYGGIVPDSSFCGEGMLGCFLFRCFAPSRIACYNMYNNHCQHRDRPTKNTPPTLTICCWDFLKFVNFAGPLVRFYKDRIRVHTNEMEPAVPCLRKWHRTQATQD